MGQRTLTQSQVCAPGRSLWIDGTAKSKIQGEARRNVKERLGREEEYRLGFLQ